MDNEVFSFDLAKMNIDAMLAITFAQNKKMMRFISKLYDAYKDLFAQLVQKNPRFKSKLITDNRVTIRFNAIKALAIISFAQVNEEMRTDLHVQIEKAYKQEAQFFLRNKFLANISFKSFIKGLRGKYEYDLSDHGMLEFISLYVYFCRHYNKPVLIDDTFGKGLSQHAYGLDIVAMMTKRERYNEHFKHKEFKDKRRKYANLFPKITESTSSLSEFPFYIKDNFPEILIIYFTWWEICTLDSIPMSMFERERLSRSEMEDIFNIVTMHMTDEKPRQDYIMIAILGAVILRGLAKVYHEAVHTIEQYEGIIKNTDRDEQLIEEAKKLHQKVESQDSLISEKQEILNTQQLEVDRLKKELREKDTEIAQLREQNQLLRQFIQDEEQPDRSDDNEDNNEVSTEEALKAKVVVIGGTTAWQSAVKGRAENYVCVDIKDDAFDTRIINSADAVVFKIDYLSHKQFYRVIDKIRKLKLPVIYCSNNIDLMLKKIASELSKRG